MMNSRLVYTGMFLVCFGLIGFGLYLQHAQGLEPCPLCILQRYAFIAIGMIALVAALQNPGTTGRWVYSVLLVILAGLGGGAAARHVWLEHYPPKVFDCGADFGYMMESLPLADALPMIFRGNGDCTKVLWRFLGLSIAEWALIWFAIFLVAAIVAAAMKPKRLRMFDP
jgi:disulfide bond formation protein DsbB